VKVGWDLVGGW